MAGSARDLMPSHIALSAVKLPLPSSFSVMLPFLLHPEKQKERDHTESKSRRVRIATSFRTFRHDRRPRLVSLAWKTDLLYLISLSAGCTEVVTSER